MKSSSLDHAGARPVEIEKRVVTVREIVASERVDERRIDPLGVEYLEQQPLVRCAGGPAVRTKGGEQVSTHWLPRGSAPHSLGHCPANAGALAAARVSFQNLKEMLVQN